MRPPWGSSASPQTTGLSLASSCQALAWSYGHLQAGGGHGPPIQEVHSLGEGYTHFPPVFLQSHTRSQGLQSTCCVPGSWYKEQNNGENTATCPCLAPGQLSGSDLRAPPGSLTHPASKGWNGVGSRGLQSPQSFPLHHAGSWNTRTRSFVFPASVSFPPSFPDS